MNITELIQHPEMMDRDTLYELRSTLALYPYFQTARLLMLQNLFILHDPSFDEELRRAAIYITDRKVLFRLVEAAHYRVRKDRADQKPQSDNKGKETASAANRTISLIDNFLDTSRPGTQGETSPTTHSSRRHHRLCGLSHRDRYHRRRPSRDRAETPPQRTKFDR